MTPPVGHGRNNAHLVRHPLSPLLARPDFDSDSLFFAVCVMQVVDLLGVARWGELECDAKFCGLNACVDGPNPAIPAANSACSSAKSTSTATPTSIWSRPSARTAAPSSASSRTLAARMRSLPPVASSVSLPRWPATPSVPWCCPNSRLATLTNSPASASARRCCSGGYGSRPAAWR